MHLVRLGLEPVEEALHAVPVRLARLVPAHPVVVALDHPALLRRAELAPRRVERHAAPGRELLEVVLAVVVALRLEDLHGARAERLRLVGNDEAVVDADHAPEAAAGIASADRRVEREASGRRIRVMDVAMGAVQVGGEAPDLGSGGWENRGQTRFFGPIENRGQTRFFRPLVTRKLQVCPQLQVCPHEHVHAPVAHPQRRFQRLHHARLLRARHAHAVLHDLEVPPLAVVDARVALRLEKPGDLLLGEVDRYIHGERDHEARVARRRRARLQLGEDRLGRVAPHGLRASAAEEPAGACEEQLQVVVDLRHRPDRRARGAHRVGLVDRDGGRDAFDRVHLRLVHAVQELPRVGRERLDVAALALGVERVEDERGLARARRPRDDDELAGGKVDVEVLEVVLPGAADADRLPRCVVQCGGGAGRAGGEVVHGVPEGAGPQRGHRRG